MKRAIATGIQDFEKLRDNQVFYIDKTALISEWWKGQDDVTLITRPRRFGKTLNLSMMNCFFSNKYAKRGDLFEGLKVWEDPELLSEQGTWPVIFMSFAGIKQATYEDTRKALNQLIADLMASYRALLQEPAFTDEDRAFFKMVSAGMPDYLAAVSIKKLCEWLERHYGKKVLIFLDEYDAPLQEAWVNGFWADLVAYIRALFNNTFKTNPSLYRAIMTGVTRVSKEPIFSDLNNLVVVTTTSDLYATSFGFTEPEVFQALEDQGFSDSDKLDVKTWYDGFTFGAVTDIYNPWSVTNYLNEGKLEAWWANTSSNGLVGTLIRQGDPDVKMQFETLLDGGALTVPIDEQIVFDQLDDNPEAIWSLLVATGYLKVASIDRKMETGEGDDNLYALELTNLEVRRMFRDMVRGWFKKGKYFGAFVTAMLRGNELDMNRYMNRIALNIFSYFDTGKGPGPSEPERFYHGFVLGLLVDRAADYELKSNRESGFGRYDVMMIPKKGAGPGVIMEFKVLDAYDGESTLEDTAANALKQIGEKQYETELLARGISSENILKYGFAFSGKECLIRKG